MSAAAAGPTVLMLTIAAGVASIPATRTAAQPGALHHPRVLAAQKWRVLRLGRIPNVGALKAVRARRFESCCCWPNSEVMPNSVVLLAPPREVRLSGIRGGRAAGLLLLLLLLLRVLDRDLEVPVLHQREQARAPALKQRREHWVASLAALPRSTQSASDR